MICHLLTLYVHVYRLDFHAGLSTARRRRWQMRTYSAEATTNRVRVGRTQEPSR
jgi:hypothetical protein